MENKTEISYTGLSNGDKSKIIAVVILFLAIIVFTAILHYKAVANAKTQKEKNWIIFMIVFTMIGGFAARHLFGSMDALRGK